MSKRRPSTAAIRWWPSGSAVRACRGGSWWRATTTHIHRWRPALTSASWHWPVRISSRRRAALTVAIVVLSSVPLIVAAIIVIAIITLVLVVLLLVVLLGTRSARILSLRRRSWVCHLKCRRGCAACFCRSLLFPSQVRQISVCVLALASVFPSGYNTERRPRK